jgi:hypothetical protein
MIKLSLMGNRSILFWGLVWIVIAYFITLRLTQMSMSEALEYFNLRNISLLGFVEIIIFISYLFFNGKGGKLLSLYPGLMLTFPIALISYGVSRIATGIDFKVVGAIVAVLVAIILVGGILFLRWLHSDKTWLYISSLLTLIIYIFVYGIS